jgi:hypothetical protein
MKKFLHKLLLIVLPVLIFLAVCEINYRVVDNDYRYKKNWLDANAQSVQIWCLGSSHSYLAVAPDSFDLKTFNSAHVAQDLRYDKYIFDKYFDRMDNLQYLILTVSYQSPFFNLETSLDSFRSHYYKLYYDCDFHKREPLYNVKIFNGEQFRRAVRKLFDGSTVSSYTDLGQGKFYDSASRQKDLNASGKERVSIYNVADIDHKLYEQNLEYCLDIISRCADRGVRVIILTTPVWASYRENTNETQREMFYAFCERLVDDNDNVVWVNLWDDSRFDEDDFYDGDHLSFDRGAIKLSNILNSAICK